MKRRILTIVAVAVALLVGAYGWWQFGTRKTPAGQTPLVTLNASSMTMLRDDFNRAAGQPRVVLLLSPT